MIVFMYLETSVTKGSFLIKSVLDAALRRDNFKRKKEVDVDFKYLL